MSYWTHQRGVKYKDGLYLPTRDDALPDLITSATPQDSFKLSTKLGPEIKEFIIKVEINHSTDFNQYYPKDAKQGEKNYSGGEWGSGRPAVVYLAKVGLNTDQKVYQVKLIGHSSADRSSGELAKEITLILSIIFYAEENLTSFFIKIISS